MDGRPLSVIVKISVRDALLGCKRNRQLEARWRPIQAQTGPVSRGSAEAVQNPDCQAYACCGQRRQFKLGNKLQADMVAEGGP
jgi:hypothetical protein